MKKLLIALTLLTLSPRLARAQEAKTPIVAEKVLYSRAVPKALAAFMPRGGKSRFWGATKLRWEGKPVWVHVYDLQKAQYPKDQENVDGVQKCGVDFFTLSPLGQLKRILSSRFHYGRYGGYKRGSDPETIGVETLWLDPKTRKTPIIKIELQNHDGLYGTITQDAFLIFKKSFNTLIVQQQFGYGNSNSSGYNSWHTSFGLDKKGLLTIIYTQGSEQGGRVTTYKWVNNYFRPSERKYTDGLFP